MSQLSICDLSFMEWDLGNSNQLQGGRSGRLTPTVSTDVATAVDTKATTRSRIQGNGITGFQISTYVRSSSAAASAAAVSIGGTASAEAYADAG